MTLRRKVIPLQYANVIFLTEAASFRPYALSGASGLRRFRGATHARSELMTGADKVICQAATVLLLFTLTSAPAKAQFAGFGGGGGGGGDMMTQMAPMLEMMKAKMGKRRFAMLMQTMGPMMSGMMDGSGGGGLGGMMGGGGLGGIPGGFSGGGIPGGFGGGDIMGMIGGGGGGGDIMGMIGPMMRMANFGGGGHRRHHRR
jgi:hypothetical protein